MQRARAACRSGGTEDPFRPGAGERRIASRLEAGMERRRRRQSRARIQPFQGLAPGFAGDCHCRAGRPNKTLFAIPGVKLVGPAISASVSSVFKGDRRHLQFPVTAKEEALKRPTHPSCHPRAIPGASPGRESGAGARARPPDRQLRRSPPWMPAFAGVTTMAVISLGQLL